MKYLILLCLISFSAGASNWMPLSVIQFKGVAAYSLKADCEKSGEPCLDLSGDDLESLKAGFLSLQNDWGPEQYEEVCEGEPACQIKLAEKSCPGSLQKFIAANFTKVYCVELLGKKLLKDESGWAAYKVQAVQRNALESGIQIAQNTRKCGERVMDLLLVRNKMKNPALTKPQVKQLVNSYKDVMALLQSGSLATAKDEIAAINPDGVIVTASDKTALIAEIDKCLGL